MTTENPLLLTVVQAGQRLGVCRSIVFRLLANGELPRCRIGRSTRIPAAAVEAYVQRLTQDASR